MMMVMRVMVRIVECEQKREVIVALALPAENLHQKCARQPGQVVSLTVHAAVMPFVYRVGGKFKILL